MIITQTPFRMSFFGGGTDMESFFRENGGAVLSTTFDKYTDEVESIFEKLVGEYEMPVILGCTELPILYEKYRDNIEGTVYDPLQIALRLLKKEYDYE